MRMINRNLSWGAIGVALLSVSISGDSQSVVVTNPPPAVQATMQLVNSSNGIFVWNVQGKLKPSYRGFGADIHLVCQRYNDVIGQVGNSPLVFPVCDQFGCPGSVNSCGDFAFPVSFAGSAPQLDPTYFCNFVVHVEGSKAPQACNKAPNPDLIAPADPNGTAPCSGGFCPEAF